jgi:hypothetical protein
MGERLATTSPKRVLAEEIANYVETHGRWDDLTKREAVIEAVLVLTEDIGAAQQFVQAIGVDVDLYTYKFGAVIGRPTPCRNCLGHGPESCPVCADIGSKQAGDQ